MRTRSSVGRPTPGPPVPPGLDGDAVVAAHDGVAARDDVRRGVDHDAVRVAAPAIHVDVLEEHAVAQYAVRRPEGAVAQRETRNDDPRRTEELEERWRRALVDAPVLGGLVAHFLYSARAVRPTDHRVLLVPGPAAPVDDAARAAALDARAVRAVRADQGRRAVEDHAFRAPEHGRSLGRRIPEPKRRAAQFADDATAGSAGHPARRRRRPASRQCLRRRRSRDARSARSRSRVPRGRRRRLVRRRTPASHPRLDDDVLAAVSAVVESAAAAPTLGSRGGCCDAKEAARRHRLLASSRRGTAALIFAIPHSF